MIENRVSALLGERRLTMTDLARGAGISRATAWRLYHGRADRIDLPTLDKLCAYFGVGVGDVFRYVPGTAVGDESPSLLEQPS